MPRVLLKEAEVSTIGELKAALELIPDEVFIGDVFEEPLKLSWYKDDQTGEETIEVS